MGNMACSAWGECYTCGARISYLVDTVGLSRAGAGQQVSDEFEEACGACGGSCFGEFSQVVSEQGGGVGGEIVAASDEACKVACLGDPNCKSFVYCPGWGKCWMKDRQLNGTESTGPQSDCRTYYETEFCSYADISFARSAEGAGCSAMRRAFCIGSRLAKSFACLGVSRGILHSTMLYRVYAPSVSDAALSAASRGGGLGARIGFGCATLHQALRRLKARSFWRCSDCGRLRVA